MNITSQVVKDYFEELSTKGIKIVYKKRSYFIKLIAWFLNFFRILSKEIFMNYFSTTIGNTIYTNFKTGDPLYSFVSQLFLAAHEHTHVLQYRKEKFIFFLKYIFSSSSRAKYEAEAYTANIELHYFLFKEIIDVNYFADSLKYYKCSKKDIEKAINILNKNISLIKEGKIISESSKEIIAWLNNRFEKEGE